MIKKIKLIRPLTELKLKSASKKRFSEVEIYGINPLSGCIDYKFAY